MKLSTKLEQFRTDNPYDVPTQAKRLLASKDEALIRYAVELGLTTVKFRVRHEQRQYIKETGYAQPRERMIVSPGRVTGAVMIRPSKRTQNAMQQLVLDVWRIQGEQKLGDATAADLGEAIVRETTSATGHTKNAQFYGILKETLNGTESVRSRWTDDTLRPKIEAVFGEFRRSEAA
jgi:hypothetical protein